MNQRWTAIIMAAGAGTRMRSSLPKVTHPIAGRPLVRHVIEAARAAGIDDVVAVVGVDAGAGAVRAAAGDSVRFAVQPQALGTGHAVECARDAAVGAECVLILNGDVPLVLPSTLRRLMAAIENGRADLAVLTAKVPVESYGFLDLDGDAVTRIIETKETEGIDRAEPRLINAGQYAVRASWLWPHLARIAPAPNGERYLTQLAAMAHDEGNPAVAVVAEAPGGVRHRSRGRHRRLRAGRPVRRAVVDHRRIDAGGRRRRGAVQPPAARHALVRRRPHRQLRRGEGLAAGPRHEDGPLQLHR